jgi:hypothetical protein
MSNKRSLLFRNGKSAPNPNTASGAVREVMSKMVNPDSASPEEVRQLAIQLYGSDVNIGIVSQVRSHLRQVLGRPLSSSKIRRYIKGVYQTEQHRTPSSVGVEVVRRMDNPQPFAKVRQEESNIKSDSSTTTNEVVRKLRLAKQFATEMGSVEDATHFLSLLQELA